MTTETELRELLTDVNEALSLGSYASSRYRYLIGRIPALLDELDKLRARGKALEGELIRCGHNVTEMHLVAPPEISKKDVEAMQAVIAALAAHDRQEGKP